MRSVRAGLNPGTAAAGIAGIAGCLSLFAQQLILKATPDQVQVSAPNLHFLAGRPLERLRNGNSVAFDFHLAILNHDKQQILRRNFERFVISYDLWEEKFSIARMRSTRSSVSHLSAAAAETWCMDNMAVSSGGLPDEKPVWVRLEIRAQDSRAQRSMTDEEGLSLANLIEIFSRPAKAQDPQHWRLEAGPVYLRDIRKSGGRTGT